MAAATKGGQKHRRPAHAMPSARRAVFRRGAVNARHVNARHAVNARHPVAADQARVDSNGMPPRATRFAIRERVGVVSRRLYAAAIPTPDRSTDFLPPDTPRLWRAEPASTLLIGAAMIGCVAIAVIFGVASLSRPSNSPVPHESHDSTRAGFSSGSAPTSGPPYPASDGLYSPVPPADPAQADANAPLGEARGYPSDTAPPDLAQLAAGLSPPQNFYPDFESALSELDTKAARDESIRQRQAAGQLPSSPPLGAPAAPADRPAASPNGAPDGLSPTAASDAPIAAPPAPDVPALKQNPDASPVPQPLPEGAQAVTPQEPLEPPPGPVN